MQPLRILNKAPRKRLMYLRFLKKEFIIYLLIYWLRWVFVAARGLSLVAASRGYSSLPCAGFSCCRAQALGMWPSVVVARGLSSCGSRTLECRRSVVVVHGLSCSVACGIFPDQGSNPCPLHWQADS